MVVISEALVVVAAAAMGVILEALVVAAAAMVAILEALAPEEV